MSLSYSGIAPLLLATLLLSACGGDSGGGSNNQSSTPAPGSSSSSSSSSSSTSSFFSSSSVVSSASSSSANDCDNTSGTAQIGCHQGSYTPVTRYKGDPIGWERVVISPSGDIQFEQNNVLSLSVNQIASITAEPGKLTVEPLTGHALESITLFVQADGSLRDIEYVQGGHTTGVALSDRTALPGWVQNPNTLINNGIAGTLNNQLYLLYHTPSETSVYADNRGLFFNGNNQSGDSWTIIIDTNNLQTNVDYLCNPGTQVTLEVAGTDKYSSANGGQCRIQLTTIELLADKRIDYIDGIFVAELSAGDRRQAPQVVDGRFRFDVN